MTKSIALPSSGSRWRPRPTHSPLFVRSSPLARGPSAPLAPGIGGIPGILSTIVAGYALVASSVYATALWPIVCDPRREGPLREQRRLALAVMLLRPVQIAVLTVITVLAVLVSVQLVAPAVFLPLLVMLAIAGYVVDVADRLRPIED